LPDFLFLRGSHLQRHNSNARLTPRRDGRWRLFRFRRSLQPTQFVE
jgi:hypothetical protein